MAFSLNDRIQKVGFERARPMADPVLPWLKQRQGPIMDFGCGLGHIGYLISQQTSREMTYLDVRKYPYPCPGVEIKTFNGREIPLADKTFDTSLIFFVLHHVPNPARSIKEVIRVTAHEIIVFEDLLYTRNEIILEAIKDTVTNCFLPHMTMKYHIESDWEKMFIGLGLKIVDRLHIQSKYIFNFKHVAWRLSLD